MHHCHDISDIIYDTRVQNIQSYVLLKNIYFCSGLQFKFIYFLLQVALLMKKKSFQHCLAVKWKLSKKLMIIEYPEILISKCRIRGSVSSAYEEYYLMGCNAV
jgi:hypothetical protein